MKSKKIFGLDISDQSIEAIQLKSTFGRPKVTAYARTILQSSLVRDGKIKEPEKLAEKLKLLLNSAQPRSIKSKYCVVSIPESQVFAAVFSLPAGLKRKEIQQTIPFKAEEVIPFKTSEVYFDFKIISKTTASQEVFYVAVPAKVIDNYVQTLKLAGLVPVAFDLESISLARAVAGNFKKSANAVVILDVGSRVTNLNIFDRNGIRHSAVIKIAGNKFTLVLAKAENHTAKQAEELKIKNGFDQSRQSKKALVALQKEAKRLAAEIKKQIEFYQSENQRKVDKVILAGGSSLMPGFDQFLADSLLIEVAIADPLGQLRNPMMLGKFKNKASLFSNVIGLGLRGIAKKPATSDINLLPLIPSEFLIVPRKNDRKNWIKVLIRLVVLIALGGLLVWILSLRRAGVDIYTNIVSESIADTPMGAELSDSDLVALEELRKIFMESELGYITATTTTTTLESLEDLNLTEPLGELQIKETSLGYLNVRQGPATSFDKVAEAPSGSVYQFINQENDWYEIRLSTTTSGWVYSVFVDLIK